MKKLSVFIILILVCYFINAQINKTFNAFNFPSGIAVDSKGNLYVTGKNNKIIKISTDGIAHDFAGNPGGISEVKDGKGTDALFGLIRGIAIDSADNLYITDQTTIRKVIPDGTVTTIYNTGTFARPEFITVGNTGTIYVTDEIKTETKTKNIVREISSNGTVTEIFRAPAIYGLACDRNGNLYVSVKDGNHTIKKITPDEQVTTLVQGLAGPRGIAINKKGEIFFSDGWSNKVFKIVNNKAITAASGLYKPNGIAFDKAGNLFIVDGSETVNGNIRKLTAAGKMNIYCKHVFNADIKQYEDPRNKKFR